LHTFQLLFPQNRSFKADARPIREIISVLIDSAKKKFNMMDHRSQKDAIII
jgi:hypothetical protein